MENVSAGRQLIKTIEARAQSLKSLPNRGRIVPELQHFGISCYRELLVKPWEDYLSCRRELSLYFGRIRWSQKFKRHYS